MTTIYPSDTATDHAAAPDLLRGGSTLEQVRDALPGSQIIDSVLVLEPDAVYADNGDAEVRYTGLSPEQAARRYVDTGDWGEVDSTEWIDVYTYQKGCDADGDEVMIGRVSHTVALHPEEPDCSAGDEHDWQSPHEVVGGIEDSPGVWGHCGGVIIRTVCAHCGMYRIVDTWAQRPDTGEEGLESVRYEDPDEDSLAWVEGS